MNDGVIKKVIFNLIGLIMSILPVTIATLSYFPLWRNAGGGAMVSGFAVLLLVLCSMPLFRLIRRVLESPSAEKIWLISFVIFFMLSRIADQMKIISLVGLISNIVASFFFKLGGKRDEA